MNVSNIFIQNKSKFGSFYSNLLNKKPSSKKINFKHISSVDPLAISDCNDHCNEYSELIGAINWLN